MNCNRMKLLLHLKEYAKRKCDQIAFVYEVLFNFRANWLRIAKFNYGNAFGRVYMYQQSDRGAITANL